MAKYPDQFGLFDQSNGIRMLELGAGTGLSSILCRKLLDLKTATDSLSCPRPTKSGEGTGLIVATDFLPEVLDNLRTCVNLNFPSASETGIEIAKLDWTTFPTYMANRSTSPQSEQTTDAEEESSRFMDQPFDLILASDCVYDETHAKMLREVVSWTLRLPENGDQGGTFVCLPCSSSSSNIPHLSSYSPKRDCANEQHILSPIRPTFTPELESIDTHFPPHASTPSSRKEGEGEGLGKERGLIIGTRGGKRSMIGRRGEGRIDENKGYWWWEVGWA
jgi:predicted nicotinamide N-methyase